MRRRRSVRVPAAAPLLLLGFAFGCASRSSDRLPALEDYSDGTSSYAEALLAGWKAGAVPPELFASPLRWSGPLPGDGLQAVSAPPPLSIAVYSAPNAAVPETSSTDLAGRLARIRAGFASLGRCESILFDFHRT